MPHISLTEFAGIRGVTLEAVRKAIKSGRLVNSVKYNDKGKMPKVDPIVAMAEWERNTDHSKRFHGGDAHKAPRATPFQKPDVNRPDEPPAGGGPSVNQSRAVFEAYRARLAKLEYDERSGKLVDAEAVKNEAFKHARATRDAMQNIPDRVAAEFAGISDPAVIHMRLSEEIRKALEGLADARGG